MAITKKMRFSAKGEACIADNLGTDQRYGVLHMNNKIGGVLSVSNMLATENRHQGKPNGSSAGTKEKSDVSNDDSVVLTEAAQKLLDAGMDVSSGPSIDRAKIDEIKNAIANGSFRPDAEKIASRLIELEISFSG